MKITLLDELPVINGLLAGTDEAGRGPLAGNVVAAAVILNPAETIDGLDDSKKLTEKKRLPPCCNAPKIITGFINSYTVCQRN